MIYTVYLNPTLDKTVYLSRLEVGGTNRPTKVLMQGGGKALNVSVVLSNLGAENLLAGIVYDGNSHYIKGDAASHGIPTCFSNCQAKMHG